MISNKERDLFEAIVVGDFNKVVAIFNDGIDLNSKISDNDETALMIAVQQGRYEIVKFLLEKNVDLEAVDDFEQTALMFSTMIEDERIFDLLFENSADVTAENQEFSSVLMYAANIVSEAILEKILKQGVLVDRVNEKGENALEWAVRGAKKTANVELLLDYGADLYQRHKSTGHTPFMNAAAHGSLATLKMLLERGANRDDCDEFGRNAFLLAVENDQIETVLVLLGMGFDVHYRDNNGMGALDLTTYSGLDKMDALLRSYIEEKKLTSLIDAHESTQTVNF